ADRVVDSDRAGDKLVGDLQLHARFGRGGAGGQAMEQRVVFVSYPQSGDGVGGAGPVIAAPAAGHSQQALRFAGVLKDGGHAFGAQELAQLAAKGNHVAKATAAIEFARRSSRRTRGARSTGCVTGSWSTWSPRRSAARAGVPKPGSLVSVLGR